MRTKGDNLPNWNGTTSNWGNYKSDLNLYQQYRGWYIHMQTKLSKSQFLMIIYLTTSQLSPSCPQLDTHQHTVFSFRSYPYVSMIIQDYLMIEIWTLYPESRIITRISILDLPSEFVHQLVTAPLLIFHINRSRRVVSSRASKMCITFKDWYCL